MTTPATDHPAVLTVHSRAGVTEVRLTGDPAADELLRRFAARGGCVLERVRVDPRSVA